MPFTTLAGVLDLLIRLILPILNEQGRTGTIVPVHKGGMRNEKVQNETGAGHHQYLIGIGTADCYCCKQKKCVMLHSVAYIKHTGYWAMHSQ